MSLYLLASVGWFCAFLAIERGPDQREMMLGSPFFWPGAVTELASLGRAESALWPAAILWTVIYALGALALLAATLATFNRCLGRMSSRGSSRGALVREQQTASSNSAGPGCTVGSRGEDIKVIAAHFP